MKFNTTNELIREVWDFRGRWRNKLNESFRHLYSDNESLYKIERSLHGRLCYHLKENYRWRLLNIKYEVSL